MNKPGLVNGGLSGLFWSLVWTHVGQLFIVLSLAEIASLAPSSRGQFHYVSECGPVAWQSWLSYFSGWLSTIAWQSTAAVDSVAIGGIIDALIAINNPTYDPARWVTTGLTILTILLVAAFNTVAAGHLSFAEGVFMTCHVFAFVPICVTLWVMVSPKTSAAEVFAHFKDCTGSWSSTGLSVMVGQGANVFVTSRCDAVANLAEEVEDAGLIIPQGMVWAFLLNIPLTLIMLLTYTFNFGPVDEAIGFPYPFIHVFHDALRSPGATTAFTIVVLILLIMITISTFAATSRQTFAFARENGLPYSNWISRVSLHFGVPINAVILTAACTIALSLLNLVTHTAFRDVLYSSVTATMAAYVLSIFCILFKRVRGQPIPKARWTLGRAGVPVNCVALLYGIWSLFWSLWPERYHITTWSFNWALIVFVVLMSVSALMYYRRAKRSARELNAKGQVE